MPTIEKINTRAQAAKEAGVSDGSLKAFRYLKDAPKAKGTRSQKLKRVTGGAKVEPPEKDDIPTLASVGITKKESSRSQELAAVPEAEFEAALVVEPGKELNHNRVLKQAKEKRQRQDRKSKRTEAAKDAKLDERIIVGDFRKHADKIADGSLSLIFTDPPYDREASKMPNKLNHGAERQTR